MSVPAWAGREVLAAIFMGTAIPDTTRGVIIRIPINVLAGLIFGVGLLISGMAAGRCKPAKFSPVPPIKRRSVAA